LREVHPHIDRFAILVDLPSSFMGIFVGAWAACMAFCYYIHVHLEPIFDANGGIIPKPEIRLYPAPIAAFCIPIAMFGFGWTGMYPDVHWMVPM
jgi:hypothetical protein